MSLRQQNKARARANILTAAAQLIAQQGGRNTTTRQIALQAGVSYQTLYNYFPSKAHIVRALIEADLQHFTTEVDQVIKRYDGDLLTTLAEINRRCFDVMRGEKLELWREIMAHFSNWAQGADQELATFNAIAHERYHALLSMAQGVRELQPGVDLHLLAHTLFCLTDYAMLRYLMALNAREDTDQNAHMQTLMEQLTLLLTPYLAGNAVADLRSGG
jgi:AcrR family transcriptional regulator